MKKYVQSLQGKVLHCIPQSPSKATPGAKVRTATSRESTTSLRAIQTLAWIHSLRESDFKNSPSCLDVGTVAELLHKALGFLNSATSTAGIQHVSLFDLVFFGDLGVIPHGTAFCKC